MNNIVLFLSAAFIWGSTWLMITFQLGSVEPLVSVIYRFGLASFVLFVYSYFTRKRFNYSVYEHLLIFLQGLFMFGFNYWLTYLAITKINSSMAAILSTSIVYFNVIFASVFLGDKIKREVVIGASIGVVGIIFVFLPQETASDQLASVFSSSFWSSLSITNLFNQFDSSSSAQMGITLLLLGSIFASLGNIISAKTQRLKIPVIQANALGMAYAVILLMFIAVLTDVKFGFEVTFEYIGSLVYLSIFGTVIAFGAFLTLLGKIGPDKAGYISLIYPIIALGFSTVYEDYQWSIVGGVGVLIILLGNFVAMGKYRFMRKK